MKTRYKILIILIIVILLFFIKGDLTYIFNRLYNNFANQINALDSVVDEELPSKVDTPGALEVANKNVTSSKDAQQNKISLSKEKIIEITNKYRKENGDLPELVENSKLDSSAEKKAEDMFKQQYFDHISPSGEGVSDLADEVEYEYILIGENLAMGNFKDEEEIVSAWYNSEGHRRNMLNSYYTEIGVAVKEGTLNGEKVWIAIQHFATPKDICSSVSEDLHSQIIDGQQQISEMEENLNLKKNMISKGIYNEGSSLNKEIKEYNSGVEYYNNLIQEVREKIKIYNQQIADFNNCLSLYE